MWLGMSLQFWTESVVLRGSNHLQAGRASFRGCTLQEARYITVQRAAISIHQQQNNKTLESLSFNSSWEQFLGISSWLYMAGVFKLSAVDIPFIVESTSGSYISTPESGSEIIISIMRDHIFRKNPNHTEYMHLLRSSEGVDANKGPDMCVADAQQTLINSKEQSTMYHSGQSQPMQGSHASHIVGIPGVDDGSTSCLYVEDNKESTGIKMTELVDGSAYVANRCYHDNKRIYVGGSQTEHEVWSGDALECTDMNVDVVLLKEDQDSLSKKVDLSKDGGDLECGEASNSVLDCQSSSLVDTDLLYASDPSTSLRQSEPIPEFNLVDVETSSMRQQLEVKHTDRNNPNNGNAAVLLKTATVTASENGRNALNGLQEAKYGQISDVEKDNLAPTFDLGF